jgi:HAMP domain-containing protein
MSTPDKTFLWSDRFSLRAQLAVGFVLVIALTLTVGFVALLGQGRSVSAVDKLLAVDGRIAELSMKSNAAMLKARRAEKDFLLFQSEFGFNEARSRYATLLRINLADISHYMAEIRALVGDPALVEQTRAIEQAIAQYETGFLKVVGTYGELGREDTGLEGRFRAKARSIESALRSAMHHRLLTGLLTLRRHEKDFLLRGIDKSANAFAQEMDRFKADVASASLPKAPREALLGLANEYSSLFEQYVKTGDRIDAEKSAYLTAAHTVEPLLDKLHFNATQSAIGTRNGVERAARTTSWMIIVASLSAALLGLTIAWLFSRNITRSVRETLDFAKGVAQGNLTTRLAPRGENEFGTLAVALNEMTEGLQQSRASLEARAADLAQSNRALQEEIGVRTRTEEALRGIDRARKVRVACNQVLIHATSEPEFLNDMCRTMVEAGGYGMAWIGYGGQSQTKPSLPVAVARANRGYVSTDELSCAEEEHRSGVTGTVHRTGKPMVLRNMPNDPRFGPLPERAFERGYTSALALPLQGDAGSDMGNLIRTRSMKRNNSSCASWPTKSPTASPPCASPLQANTPKPPCACAIAPSNPVSMRFSSPTSPGRAIRSSTSTRPLSA